MSDTIAERIKEWISYNDNNPEDVSFTLSEIAQLLLELIERD